MAPCLSSLLALTSINYAHKPPIYKYSEKMLLLTSWVSAGVSTASMIDSALGVSTSEVKAKLNITVVKTPEVTRRGRIDSLSGKTSHRRRKVAGGNINTSTATTAATTTTTVSHRTGGACARDGAPILEYAKVHKRKTW